MDPAMGDLAWDDLRLLLVIAASGGLPGAAHRLGIDPSTAFRRLGRIEGLLGQALFERHRSGYVPTPAGEALVALAARIEQDTVAVLARLEGGAPEPAGEVRIATSDTLLTLLVPLIAGLAARHGQLRFDLVLGNPAANLSRRDADIAIRATRTPPETLVGRRLATIAWALYGRAGVAGAGAARRVVPGSDLADLPVTGFLARQAGEAAAVCRINTVSGMADAIEAGIGIGYLPCFVGDARPQLQRLALPEPELATDLWLLTHPDLRAVTRVRAVLDGLGDGIARLRPFIEGSGPNPA